MVSGVCEEPLCRHSVLYRYQNIQINIDTHLNFIENRLNEHAGRALFVLHEYGGDPVEAQRQLDHWVVLYRHYREVLGRSPLPDGYSIRLLADGSDDQ